MRLSVDLEEAASPVVIGAVDLVALGLVLLADGDGLLTGLPIAMQQVLGGLAIGSILYGLREAVTTSMFHNGVQVGRTRAVRRRFRLSHLAVG